MKSYIKGIITGFLISATVFAIPVVAENVDALFNQVRINVNGVDEIQWGENIELDNGETTPSSILYNGTTYLPMRKLGELSGNKIYWNGDSRTVSITGRQKDIEVIAEKPDKNGNVWKYYTFKVSEYNSHDKQYYDVSYLGIKDEVRGYERVYEIASSMNDGNPMCVTDDAIYFIRKFPLNEWHTGRLVKLSFDNDTDTQDGEVISELRGVSGDVPSVGYVAFDGNVVYYSTTLPHSHYNQTTIWVYNYETNEKDCYSYGVGTYFGNIRIENDAEKAVFTYEITNGNAGPSQGDYAVVFDKKSFTFGEMYKVEGAQ